LITAGINILNLKNRPIMQTFEVDGYYGSQKTPCKVLCAKTRNGTWYCVEDSKNVNLTLENVQHGVHVEYLQDVDMFTAGAPINSLEELENAINS
jgi:hypothetical protein